MRRNTVKRSTLNSELQLAKELGFEATSKNSKARNPYMLLADGSCLLWIAGSLIGVVTTEEHFGQKKHRQCWKSSNKNKPDATLTTTEVNSNGIGVHTEIYYREVYKSSIESIAKDFNRLETDIVIDHINHMRGDCRKENLRPATKAQNNQNKSKTKVEKAFYTVEDFKSKLASGEWIPLKGVTI
jgi:hypothetical protein